MLGWRETGELLAGGYEDRLDRVRGVGSEEGDMGMGAGEDPDELMPDEAFDYETGWPEMDWGAGVAVPAAR